MYLRNFKVDVTCSLVYDRQVGLGSILDTVSKNTEDTAHSCILSVSKIHFQPTLLMVSVSKYLKDTEDTAFHVFVSGC